MAEEQPHGTVPMAGEHEKAMEETENYLKQRAAEEWAAAGVKVPGAEPPQEAEPEKEPEAETEAKEEETETETEEQEAETEQEEETETEPEPEPEPEPEKEEKDDPPPKEETRSQRSRRRRDERIRADAREEAKREVEAAAAKEADDLRKQLAAIRAKHQQSEGGEPSPATKEPNIDDYDTVGEYYKALDAYEAAQKDAAPPAPAQTEKETPRHSDAPPPPQNPLAKEKPEERPRIDLLADEFQAILEENDQGELVEDLIGLAQGGRLDLASEELLDDLLELDEAQVVRVATQIRDRPTRAGRLAGMARSARLSFLRKLSAPPKPKAETKEKPEPITPIRATPGSGSPDPTVDENGQIDTRAYLEMRRRETLGLQ